MPQSLARSAIWPMALLMSALVLWLGGCKSVPEQPQHPCQEKQSQCISRCQTHSGGPPHDPLEPGAVNFSDYEQCANACSREYEKCTQKEYTPD